MNENYEFVVTMDKIIKSGYFAKLTPSRRKIWLDQFVDEEKELAQYLAFKLINYSEKDYQQLVCHSITNIIKQVTLNTNQYQNLHGNMIDDNHWNSLLEDTLSRVVICPMAVEDAASSANFTARAIRDANIGIHDGHICDIGNISTKIASNSTIIFVDDIIGSGDQVNDFFSSINSSYLNFIHRYIAVAVAFKPTLNSAESISKCKVVTSEFLDMGNDITCEDFWQDINYFQAKTMLNRIKQEYGVLTGHAGLALNVAFSHGVPDFTSPIYYLADSAGKRWKSLLQ